MAAALSVPLTTTLHTPPTPWLESAIQTLPNFPVRFSAVSELTAAAWRHVVPAATVVRNGIDTRRWHPGPVPADARGRAEAFCSVEAMTRSYEHFYRTVAA